MCKSRCLGVSFVVEKTRLARRTRDGNLLNDRERGDVFNDVVLKDVTDDDVDDVASVSTTCEDATRRRGGEQLLNESPS